MNTAAFNSNEVLKSIHSRSHTANYGIDLCQAELASLKRLKRWPPRP